LEDPHQQGPLTAPKMATGVFSDGAPGAKGPLTHEQILNTKLRAAPIGSTVIDGNTEYKILSKNPDGSVNTFQTVHPYDIEHMRTLQHLTSEQKNFFHENPDLAKIPYNQAVEIHNTEQKDLNFLFGNNAQATWQVLKNQKAKDVLDLKNEPDGNKLAIKMGDYLKILREYSKVKPTWGLFGGNENTGKYMARAFQKITAEGKTQIFETAIKARITK
jgi:hypothetical protein